MSEFHTLIGKAAKIACTLHQDHVDRDGLPHIFHCMRVAMKQNSSCSVIIALLHDLIEDADSPEEALTISRLIDAEFGSYVRFTCILLTQVEGESYEQYISRIIGSGNFEAMEIKKSDIEDNTRVGRVDLKAAKKFPIYKIAHHRLCEALGVQSNLSNSSQE